MNKKKEVETSVAFRIKSARKAMGYTQENLAEKAGISTRYLQYLEKDIHEPGSHVLNRICAVLHISSDHILSGEMNEFYKINSMVPYLSEDQRFMVEKLIFEFYKQNQIEKT